MIRSEPKWVRYLLIGVVWLFLGGILCLPLGVIFFGALKLGVLGMLQAVVHPQALAAFKLTAIAVGIAVPLNMMFGLSAAWLLTKFRFKGRNFLITLLDLPFTISPVIVGMMLMLIFGRFTPIGGWFFDHGFAIVYGVPGIVLATLFVTVPFVAKALIPLMESQGTDLEEAAHTLGANGWQIFFRVTLPNIFWGLLYGVILSVARGVGEFGAVSVVSGHIQGLTNTTSLYIETLYYDYQLGAAFAVSFLLVLGAFVTLGLKWWVEEKTNFGSVK